MKWKINPKLRHNYLMVEIMKTYVVATVAIGITLPEEKRGKVNDKQKGNLIKKTNKNLLRPKVTSLHNLFSNLIPMRSVARAKSSVLIATDLIGSWNLHNQLHKLERFVVRKTVSSPKLTENKIIKEKSNQTRTTFHLRLMLSLHETKHEIKDSLGLLTKCP